MTITGAGGAGKSRLALEVAASATLERPVHLVGLAPVSDPTLVLGEIARTVGARESVERTLVDSVAEALRGSRTLLYLDNLEHLSPAARDIAALLDLVPDLDVLTTSRAPLRLSGEHVLLLDPLPVDDAETLFVELAAARGVVLQQDTLPSVREICRRLDGLPLAIELVAARLVVLPPTRILEALDEGLALEMEGPIDLPERQRTLRTTIAWSYGLLSERQQELHDALGVFAGGCTFDDARAVARAGPGFLGDLEALVAWSLVRSDVTDGDVRLSMLETVREDAVARLAERGRLDDLRRPHAERFLALAQEAEERLAGPDQAKWLDRLERELDNIRAALDWCFSHDRVEDGLRAIAALSRFWRAHGHVTEARRLALPRACLRTLICQPMSGPMPSGRLPARPLHRATGEPQRLSSKRPCRFSAKVAVSERSYSPSPSSRSWRSAEASRSRRPALSEEAVSIARDLGDARATSSALTILGEVRSAQGDHARALAHLEEAVAQRRELGDALLVTDAVFNLGWVAFLAGDLMRSRAAFEESLALARQLSDALHTAEALKLLGELDLLAGDVDGAEARIRESLAVYTDVGSNLERAACLTALGGVAASRESYEEAARLLGEAEALRGEAPLEAPERAVVEEFHPRLEAALGLERLNALKAEGVEDQGRGRPESWAGRLRARGPAPGHSRW